MILLLNFSTLVALKLRIKITFIRGRTVQCILYLLEYLIALSVNACSSAYLWLPVRLASNTANKTLQFQIEYEFL